MTQALNLWAQRGSSKKPGKELIESGYKEILFRMVPPGYSGLPTVLGIKEQLSL